MPRPEPDELIQEVADTLSAKAERQARLEQLQDEIADDDIRIERLLEQLNPLAGRLSAAPVKLGSLYGHTELIFTADDCGVLTFVESVEPVLSRNLVWPDEGRETEFVTTDDAAADRLPGPLPRAAWGGETAYERNAKVLRGGLGA